MPWFYRNCFKCFKLAFVCYHLAYFLMWSHFAAYFGQFLYLISFISHPFVRHCLVQSQCIHIFHSPNYALLNDSMPYYCFSHYLIAYTWQPFLNSNFIVFLAAFL